MCIVGEDCCRFTPSAGVNTKGSAAAIPPSQDVEGPCCCSCGTASVTYVTTPVSLGGKGEALLLSLEVWIDNGSGAMW